jgi:hypothetical protein
LNEDFRDLLIELLDGDARFLVVGAHAMAVHGVPRATGDLDVWISPEAPNAERVWAALRRFGAPIEQLGVSVEDLRTPRMVIQIGRPPRRIDLLTDLSGLDFDEAWSNRTMHSFGPREAPFLGREDLIRNKRASGRPKDLADLDALGGE